MTRRQNGYGLSRAKQRNEVLPRAIVRPTKHDPTTAQRSKYHLDNLQYILYSNGAKSAVYSNKIDEFLGRKVSSFRPASISLLARLYTERY